MYNPVERSAYIESEFKKYLKSTLKFDNEVLTKLYERDLEETDIYKGPYLSFSNAFKTNISIKEAIKKGHLSKLFFNLSDINFDMKFYEHQYQSLKKLQKGRSVVITTGTGSGKTESFLYPIIDDILKDIEKNKDHGGLRSVFLYPVNALVNDQMQRLREILREYPEITFGSYTGDTLYTEEAVLKNDRIEKNKAKNDRDYKMLDYPQNEIRSREKMRETPPMLLFTNYAMLEYILIRPKDQTLFLPNNTKNWKFMVLDEAHRYQGALGIELSHLLRRLTGKYKKRNIQYILTSATLGKGKENISEIVTFANNLTSSIFSSSDIIFAERKRLNNNSKYRLRSDDYKVLLDINNVDAIKRLSLKYNLDYNKNYEELLYEILYLDENFQNLLDLIDKQNVLHFYKILEALNQSYTFTETDLINLIDLISFASKDSSPLLICKYHVFLRTPQGAFGIFKPNIDIKISRIKEINGFKAYELGACRFCSSIFFIGNIVESKQIFIQNDSMDIYENYGDDANKRDLKKVDFLLIPPENSEMSESENIHEYILCQKCGHLKRVHDLNAKDCDCSNDYKLQVFHVADSKRTLINNITSCPVCDNFSRAGVVRAFHIQKDEATSILSQINLKSMPVKKDEIKQFIAFSDSVQQASFYATFLEYNHKKFLRKKLILDVINEVGSISLRSLSGEIKDLLMYEDLFNIKDDVDLIYTTEAWVTTLTELMKIDGQFSGEGLGLFAFILEGLREKKIRQLLSEGKYQYLRTLTVKEVIDLINLALDVFKTVPAIKYDKYDMKVDIIEEELLYRSFDNYVTKINTIGRKDRNRNNVRSFLPSSTPKYKPRPNKLIKFLYKVFNISDLNTATIIASEIWNLANELKLFESARGEPENKLINVSKYELISGDKIDWYICEKCHKISAFNVRNKCFHNGCDGTLKEYERDDFDGSRTNYYIDQYKNKEVEKLIVEEHTAQIGKKLGRVNQDLFRDQKINVLSSSTTFEMGIDIGSLDNVFLRNVPPTPANYAQRAGRAGRRLGNAGFVLTYCGISSHDYTYFKNPASMIKGIIKPPYFKTDNKKILLRHITASALGSFFQDENIYFDTLGEWLDNEGIKLFKLYVERKPTNLINYVNDSLLKDISIPEFNNNEWINYLIDENSNIQKMQEYIIAEIKSLNHAIEEARKEASIKGASREVSFRTQIGRIKDTRLINAFSSYVVIPKYGFPVDVVELEIPKRFKLDKDNSPSRDLSIAISEYAPESEIILNKKKYKSRYIKFPYQAFDKLEMKYYYECPKCNRYIVHYDQANDDFNRCPNCGEEVDLKDVKRYIIPSYGFATDIKEEKTRMLKPKKTYASEIAYLGGGIENNDQLYISDKIFAESSKEDNFLSVNKTPFFVCSECGYTKVDQKFKNLSSFIDSKSHKNKYGRECKNKKLTQYSLAHVVRTDVVKLNVEFSMSINEALSVLFALLDSISMTFNIERRDINGVINKTNGIQFVFFDQVAGGAGHVKRILNQENLIEVLQNAYRNMSFECCDENTSCYNCLRNYQNQRIHERLKRGYAKNWIKIMLEDINENKISEDRGPSKKKNSKIAYNISYSLELDEPLLLNIEYVLNDIDNLTISSQKIVEELNSLGVKSESRFWYYCDLKFNEKSFDIDAILPDEKVMLIFEKKKFEENIYNVLKNEGWNILNY